MDTTRADRCSVTGYGRRTTPRLEEFARDAVVFDDAWSPAPWTAPAHAALFTGRLPRSLGILHTGVPVLPPDAATLAGLLGAQGWATGCFTANAWISKATGLTRGFERVDSFFTKPEPPSASETHARALDFMRAQRRAGKRFFAFVNDVEPHAPYDPPEDVAKDLVDPALPAAVVADARTVVAHRSFRISFGGEPVRPETLRALSDLYDGDVALLDREVGALLDAMRAEGLLDRTLVIVAGDHGEGLGTHGWVDHGLLLHREMLRVPLVVRPPGGVAGGRRVKEVVRLEDVFPTVLAACGVAAPRAVDGRALLGDVAGRVAVAAEIPRRELLVQISKALDAPAPAVARAARRSLYDGRHHLVVDDAGGVELYDVAADPLETRNLAAGAPDLVGRLRAQLDAVDPPR
jgi:arylsulfatase A-like enzyme